MSDDTYVRAKLTEINSAIERLTQMLNRMIEVISKITELQDSNTELALAVSTNGEKLDELMQKVESIASDRSVSAPATDESLAKKGAVSSLQAVLETLETQIREGAIASDLAVKIREASSTLEQKGGGGSLVVKMQRWVRILNTYSRVDPVSPQDIQKLRTDMKEWQKDLSMIR